MKKIIKENIEVWIKQGGRTDEQIYGVKNFMSGRGLKMVEEEKKKSWFYGYVVGSVIMILIDIILTL